MKEFIDKLIAKLEKESQVVSTPITEIECLKLSDAIDAVKRVAEEYGDGWIPCEEDMPDCDGGYICTAKECQESLELIYSAYDNSWRDEYDHKYNVIAWQYKPKAYQQKGE